MFKKAGEPFGLAGEAAKRRDARPESVVGRRKFGVKPLDVDEVRAALEQLFNNMDGLH